MRKQTQALNLQCFSGEEEFDTEGQVIITDETQWADLIDEDEGWRKEKNKDKDMVLCCTLNCDSGYKPSGRNGIYITKVLLNKC